MVLLAVACRPAAAPTTPSAPPARMPADPAPEPSDAPAPAERFSVDELPPPRGVTGTWAGTYFYADDGSGPRPPVYFFADLVLDHGVLTGHIVEPNTFGDDAEAELRANVLGTINEDGIVAFRKTYDGTAGISHVVLYEGRLDDDRTTIEGRWTVGSGTQGQFIMSRQARRPDLALVSRHQDQDP
jgi:hypothetical protein